MATPVGVVWGLGFIYLADALIERAKVGADAADIALLTEGVALPVVLLLAAITTASIARVSGAVPVTRVLIPFAVWAYLVFYAVEHTCPI